MSNLTPLLDAITQSRFRSYYKARMTEGPIFEEEQHMPSLFGRSLRNYFFNLKAHRTPDI